RGADGPWRACDYRGRPRDRKRHICRDRCAPAPLANPPGCSSAGSQHKELMVWAALRRFKNDEAKGVRSKEASMITRRNFLGTTAIVGAAGTAILVEESKSVANAAAGGATESTGANPASIGATGSTVGTYLATRLEQVGVRDYFVVPGDFNLILLDQ